MSLSALPLAVALLHFSAVANSYAQTPVQLAGLGSRAFTVEPEATTAKATQSAAGLAFSSVALGDTLAGLFPAQQNWARPDYGTFGVIMSIEGTNPGLPFRLELYDAFFNIVAKFEGTTIGAGSSAGFVPLQPTPGQVQNLAAVRGLQWTWNDPGSIKATLHSLAVLISSPADTVAPVIGALPAKRYTKANEFVLRVSAQDDRGVARMTARIVRPDGKVQQLAKDFGGGHGSIAWSLKLPLDQEGPWRIQLEARDAAGNLSRRNTEVVADRSPPSIKVTSLPNAPLRAYSLSATLSDARSFPDRVRYRLRPPGGSISAWSSWQMFSDTSSTREWKRNLDLGQRGAWRIEIEVRDKAGNIRINPFLVKR